MGGLPRRFAPTALALLLAVLLVVVGLLQGGLERLAASLALPPELGPVPTPIVLAGLLLLLAGLLIVLALREPRLRRVQVVLMLLLGLTVIGLILALVGILGVIWLGMAGPEMLSAAKTMLVFAGLGVGLLVWGTRRGWGHGWRRELALLMHVRPTRLERADERRIFEHYHGPAESSSSRGRTGNKAGGR